MGLQVTYRTPVPANGVVRNALAETDLAIAPDFGFINIYGRQGVTAAGELEISFTQGTEQQMVDGVMTQNDALSPNRQDDIIAGPIPIVKGKSLRSKITETAGLLTPLNVIYDFVKADPLIVAQALGPRPR